MARFIRIITEHAQIQPEFSWIVHSRMVSKHINGLHVACFKVRQHISGGSHTLGKRLHRTVLGVKTLLAENDTARGSFVQELLLRQERFKHFHILECDLWS